MRSILRSMLVSVLSVLGLVLVGVLPASASSAAERHSEAASAESSPLAGPLVISSLDDLLGGQQSEAARQARRSAPAAVAQRRAARISFAGLSPAGAAGEARSAFPSLIEHPASGLALGSGEHVKSYLTTHAAEVSLPGGKAVIESSIPIASKTAHGSPVPFDLRLEPAGGHFSPVRSSVPVDVPRKLADGVSLPAVGVSLTPINGRGGALASSEGAIDGATVLYDGAGSGADSRDLATVAKATPLGVELTSMLFSERSPGRLYFRVGMPSGAHLRRTSGGAVQIISGKHPLATIEPVSAQDAEGLNVPVSMQVRGNVLALDVNRSGDHLYPIAVDPEINDSQLAKTTWNKRSNWEFYTSSAAHFEKKEVYEGIGVEHLETRGISAYTPTEWAYWGYQTQGISHIYEIKTETSAHNVGAKIESFLEFEEPGEGPQPHPGVMETKKVLSTESEGTAEYEHKASTLCAANASKVEECLPASGKGHNAIHFQQSATGTPTNYAFSDVMNQGIVSIAEPTGTHATSSYDTTSPTFEFEVENEGTKEKEKVTRTNILYGSGIWLTKSAGAFKANAADTGIGVSDTKLEYESSPSKWTQLAEHNYLEVENACQGVQCYPSHSEFWTVPAGLPDGEQKIRYRSEEAISGTKSLESEGLATVKVDTKKPRKVLIGGLPWGGELSERPYELTIEATDGEGSTVASSGIKSIALFIDGHEVGTPSGSCSVPAGECTASTKRTVNGAELGSGRHDIEIVVFDNAGNKTVASEPVAVRHSTPVAFGPGSVDLQSGDFSLGTTDVSMGSGLTVSRNYSSRAPFAGATGPLGPQWSVSLTSAESLVELINGSVLLTSGNGGQSIFAASGEGKFEAPIGDSNLELTLEKNEITKQKLAYYLKDVAAHTSVKFTQPAGSTVWVPTKQEGTLADHTVTFSYRTAEQATEFALPSASTPTSIATGADGNLWSALSGTNKILKMTPTDYQTEYSTVKEPEGIIAGPDGNMWFTSGSSSSEANALYKITQAGTVTSYGVTGAKVRKVATGPDGNLWFFEVPTTGGQKLGKMTPSGTITTYSLPSESQPSAIAAGPDGNVWFTDNKRNKVVKMTTGGSIVAEYSVPTGSSLGKIFTGPDGKLWFVESGTKKIAKITTGGELTEYSMPSGTLTLQWIVSGPDGNIWFAPGLTAGAAAKIDKMTTSGTVTEYKITEKNGISGLTVGPEGNIWFAAWGESVSRIGTIPISGLSIEPTEVLAPKPAGVSCEPELKAGCRALKFNYASETTALGDQEGGWGHFKATLSNVKLVAYDPASKTMKETTVAEYLYDNRGRLRAEWDPRISPSLKTYYGYDREGHLTVMQPAGQEPWAFTYGAIAGDTGTGRLLKAQRAPSSLVIEKTGRGTEILPTGVRPAVSGTLTEGVRLAVSNGVWTENTFAYAYQWKDCNTEGGACQAIAGATNPNYTLAASDVGHSIVVTVTATDTKDGTESVDTYPTAPVKSSAPITEYGLKWGSGPSAVAKGPDGKVWFTLTGAWKVGKMTTGGASTEYFSECLTECGGAPANITGGPDGNLWFTGDKSNIYKETPSGTTTKYAVKSESGPSGITAGPDGNLWFTEHTAGYVGKMSTAGTVLAEYKLPAGSGEPGSITSGPDGNLWYTTSIGADKIGKITTSGTITQYSLTSGSSASGITSGPDGNLWFTESGRNKIGKITTSGTVTEYSLPAGSSPKGITAGPDEKLWFTEPGTGKIGTITTAGVVTEIELGKGSEPWGIAVGPDSNIWYADHALYRIGKIGLSGSTTAGESISPQPGSTIEYKVPVKGAGAPHDMSASQVEKWGQKDLPEEATAIFPPDSPKGWPAASYERATVHYLDENGREVNVAKPTAAEGAEGGSISTTEYNEFNDVIRTLTPDNRQTALEAGAASVEKSKLLDTQSTYNGEGKKEGEVEEPGTLLIDTLGPQHTVKYRAGNETKESLARDHTEFFYDQGAPGGEKYRLLTEKAELAQLSNHEEVEVRSARRSYSGQSNLGWKLRAPTSVTVDPEGLKLTSTTVYDPTTGQITETRGAGAETTFSYASKFGETGTEAGKLKGPWGVAVNSEGKLWVVDSANNRVEKFGPEGSYISSFGSAGSGTGQFSAPQGIALDGSGHIWVADSGNNRIEEFSSSGTYMATVGSLGSGNGQFNAPSALAFDAKGNMWVADTGNSRVQKFDKEAKYVSQFGSLGSEPGQLKEPKGIAIDGSENVWVADTGNNRIEEFSNTGSFIRRFSTPGAGEGQLNTPLGLAIDSSGNVWVIDSANGRVEGFTPTGGVINQFGWKGAEAGQLNEPHALAFDATGKAWVSDGANNRLEQWSKGSNAHDQKAVYYGAEANAEYPSCGGHPEWSGLICETLSAKQPELMGLPKLPVTTFTYNMYNEPETTTETFGSTTRTNVTTYDEGGRRKTSETTASTGHSLPKVTFTYNEENGALEKQSASGEEHDLTYQYNALGQLTQYKDGDLNVAKYKYFGAENDYQLEEASDSSNAGASKQTYSYGSTTKLRTKVTDSAAGTFTAEYDAEGNPTAVIYPFKNCVTYTHNSVGEVTKVEYKKNPIILCFGGSAWYSDSQVPSVHGQTMSHTSTLTSGAYAYDTAGRLIEGQETPVGEGCTVRAYAYDLEANRASATTRAPGGGGACQSEGGTSEGHNYDEGNRLADGGMAYDGLGNVTTLPAADAEGHELTSSYYVDNAVYSQSQNGVTNTYSLDPEGRVRETVSGATTTVSHYDSPGEAIAWTAQGTNWTRNIAGLDGSLLATQTNGETPTLQLHDLRGNVVATLGDKSGETKLLTTYNSTEFGVPNGGKTPPKFAWLGSLGVESSLPSGVITYGATSYVPQTGRPLQSEAVAAPGLPGGSGAGAAFTMQEEPWNMQGAAREAAEAPGLEAAREQEAMGSVVDPWVSWTMNRAKAEKYGQEYDEIESIGQVLSALDLPEDFVSLLGKLAGSAVSQLGDAFKWLYDAGEKLRKCAKNTRKWNGKQVNICYFQWEQNEWTPPWPLSEITGTLKWPNFSVEPRVHECLYIGSVLGCVAEVHIDTEL